MTKTKIAALKKVLIRKNWQHAVELLDVIQEHGSNDFTEWLDNGGTVKLMNIARPYKGLPMYELADRLQFDNDVYALDAAHHILTTEPREAFFVLQSITDENGEFIACIAREGEKGYFKTDWLWGKDFAIAEECAKGRNTIRNISEDEAAQIVAITMS